MSKENLPETPIDDLEHDQRDALAATGRALAGLVPMFGGVVGELVTRTIPEQRTDRVVRYVRGLNARFDGIEARLQELLTDPNNVDLVEEGGYQSARATSDERIQHITALVANGLDADDADVIRRKRLARLLGQIDDDELALLNAYGQSYGGSNQNPFAAISRPDPAHLGSGIEEIDAEKLYEAGVEHLLSLGLLTKNYRNPPRGEAPKFDARKGDYEHSREVSYLGRLLLRFIDRPSPIDIEK